MPALHTLENQYRGINAHLHSRWQNAGGWNNFHNRHIGDIAGLLRLKLIPMGYTATIEESLQIRRVGDPSAYPRADILIQDSQRYALAPQTSIAPTLTVAEMLEDIEEEKPFRAIAIYTGDDTQTPVTWLELLSPTNKGSGWDAQAYAAKRHTLLESGLVFIEVDYLHETPPTFSRLLSYADPVERENGAHAYRIVVLDPRPDMRHGPAQTYEFAVDDQIPIVDIPLNAEDRLMFDFGAAYRKTYEEMGYGLELVDYAEYPARFDSYSRADQERIKGVMAGVQNSGSEAKS
jgi:hypothetical protein